MRSSFAVLLLLLIAHSTLQMYGAGSKVVQLNQNNFKDKVLNSPGIWMVEFYAPWCGHCKSLAPEWEKAAKGLEGIVNIGAVDMTTDQPVGAPYNIQGYPTIKLFGLNKNNPIDFQGGRDATSIINFAIDQSRSAAINRASGNAGGSRTDGNKNSGSQGGPQGGSAGGASGSAVVVLNNGNFAQEVYNSKSVWMVEFYAPWCGHCKKLQPEWDAASNKLKGAAQLGKVNCDEEQSLCQSFGVRGYPTIKYFKPESTGPGSAEEYQGGREEPGIVQYGMELFTKFGGNLEVPQMINQDQFKKNCLETDKNACLLFFLPSLYDVTVEQRIKALKDIETVMKDFFSYPITFAWTQGGDQFDFEQQFPLGAGYPALLTLVPKKKKYSVMRTGSGFEVPNIKNYITRLLAGNEGIYDLPQQIAAFRKVDAWSNPSKQKSA